MRTSALPPLDLHAHIDTSVPADDLAGLGAVVFAATRSLTEAARAVQRHDERIIWGVGIHPGLARSHTGFDPDTFTQLIDRTPLVSEIGLDGKSRVPMDRQQATLRRVLDALARTPRIASIHSYAACEQVLSELERAPAPGMVLHWWLGDPAQTARAVSLGCYFSLNASAVRKTALLETIPLDRVLTETDHPFGDRSSDHPLPGNVALVEQTLARHHRTTPENIRQIVWHNLAALVRDTRCAAQLSRRVRSHLASLPPW
ncbi:TatD family hydrolase [Streptomyces albidoflavus]|jgi:TatD DNase family protein|uniref:TatD family hydrolase n=1 Tax=Streptomyces albidoflavus TaxID=1886 RepID=UPI001C4662DB|nr:TatD family hydrolase [Streptomyces albidoflavus]MBV7653649.1 TatD family hydrolase [Streptomyces albidoflavus]MBV7714218.1 TatD family hydrolase [Streptomyces albidoflavus]